MSKHDDQREYECVEFGCPYIFKCITFLGKNCTRQGGEKIPTHRVMPQPKRVIKNGPTNARVDRPYPRSQMMRKGYFMEDGHEVTEGREWDG
ncbi:MAG: hypothetical protein WA125_16825 [Desulfosporosinus sp.]